MCVHYSHGEKEAAPSHRRNGSEDPDVPRAEVSSEGVAEIRPGLRDHEAASHWEDAARVGLAGRPQGESPLLAAGGDADVRSGPHVHP